uniref:Uncharacterized protein n=1 Tax=Chromera velia CCMP2878 TaxID=1169474 RepID=A0A0G4HLA9_9ALVE|eukprot:Cvel_1130.t1-p1 / transcript=Cvel_1130.t1 / gene=Cvel_1130 / organism=Chromera_velia_CCMP2878 / gene_product=hypothetical protein / transcript_product=hypothetical protein / location=Cvel_scaffold37:73002-77908(+) / protein_length=130 / sequence_SO=supercontig / SO=protein_coding / is_pseudo=false
MERVVPASTFYTQGPAPNAYNLPQELGDKSMKYKNTPKWRFPQSPRNSDYWSQGGRGNPGPGSYDPSGSVSQFRGKRPESYSMAGLLSSRASPLLKTDRPGPGSYRGEDPGPTTSSSSAWKPLQLGKAYM